MSSKVVQVRVGPLLSDHKVGLYMACIQIEGHTPFELEVDHQDCIELRGTPEDVLLYKLERVLDSMGIDIYSIQHVGLA